MIYSPKCKSKFLHGKMIEEVGCMVMSIEEAQACLDRRYPKWTLKRFLQLFG